MEDLSDTGICTEVILIYKHGRPQWHRYNNLQTGIIVVVAVDYKKLLDIIEKNNFEKNTIYDYRFQLLRWLDWLFSLL
jgi:hypothetical protein